MDPRVRDAYLRAGRIAKEARDLGARMIEDGEGLPFLEVAEAVEGRILELGAGLAFPVNITVNNEAAHYSPVPWERRVFREGDMVKLDVGAHVDGYIADTAVTVIVGGGDHPLMEAVRAAIEEVISGIRVGMKVSEIGSIIERTIRSRGFRPVYNLTGHSLGRYRLHAGLSIPNFDDGSGARILPGMAVAIEPFGTDGKGIVRNDGDGHIYMLNPDRPPIMEGFARKISALYDGLPFAERWLARDYPEARRDLPLARRARVLVHYPKLVEGRRKMVAQFEHTFLLTEDDIIVTTK